MRSLGTIPLWVNERDLPPAPCAHADMYYDRVRPVMLIDEQTEYIGCSCPSCSTAAHKPVVRPSLESTKFFSFNCNSSKKMHGLYDNLQKQVSQLCAENNIQVDITLQQDMKDIKKTIDHLSNACKELANSSKNAFATVTRIFSGSPCARVENVGNPEKEPESKEEQKTPPLPARIRTKRRPAIVPVEEKTAAIQEHKQHASSLPLPFTETKKLIGSCFICQKDVFDTQSFLSVHCPQHKCYVHRSCRKGICLQGEKSKCLDSKCVYMVTRIESKPVGKSTYLEYENINVRKYRNDPHVVEVVHLDTVRPQKSMIKATPKVELAKSRKHVYLRRSEEEKKCADSDREEEKRNEEPTRTTSVVFVRNEERKEEQTCNASYHLISNPSDQCFVYHPLCDLRSILFVQ